MLGGAIITPAAPSAIDSRASVRIAANPGAVTPTITGVEPKAWMKRLATARLSAASSFGASPSWPSTVTPVEPVRR